MVCRDLNLRGLSWKSVHNPPPPPVVLWAVGWHSLIHILKDRFRFLFVGRGRKTWKQCCLLEYHFSKYGLWQQVWLFPMNDKVDIEMDRKYVGTQRKSDIVSRLWCMIIFLVIHFYWTLQKCGFIMDWKFNRKRNGRKRKKEKWLLLQPDTPWEEGACLHPGLCFVTRPSTRMELVEIKRSGWTGWKFEGWICSNYQHLTEVKKEVRLRAACCAQQWL